MPQPSLLVSRLARSLAAVLLAGLAIAPAGAQAADAPLRTIGIGTDGTLTTGIQAIAVSPDGVEVLGSVLGQPVIRNVAAGTTTKLLGSGDIVNSVTPDLQKVLYLSEARVVAADTDSAYDLYLLDRATGTSRLVTTPATFPNDPVDTYTGFGNPQLSADGQVVSFYVLREINNRTNYTVKQEQQAWRWNAGTGQLAQVVDLGVYGIYTQTLALDTAGRVSANKQGVFVDGARRWPLPLLGNSDLNDAWVSPDGSTVAVANFDTRRKRFALLDVATGAVRTVTVPTWVQALDWRILRAKNGGAGVTVGTVLDRGQGPRYVVGTITPAGSVTQIGGDIKVTNASTVSAISDNLQFAASNLHLAQLGTLPLPGTEPVVSVPASKATDYVNFTDTFCTRLFGNAWTRARVGNNPSPIGADTRSLVKSEWNIFDTATKKTINAFTLSGAGRTRDLTVPRTGGFTLAFKVTLSDGATLSGLWVIAPHPQPACESIPL